MIEIKNQLNYGQCIYTTKLYGYALCPLTYDSSKLPDSFTTHQGSTPSFFVGDDPQLAVVQDHRQTVAGLNPVTVSKCFRYRNI